MSFPSSPINVTIETSGPNPYVAALVHYNQQSVRDDLVKRELGMISPFEEPRPSKEKTREALRHLAGSCFSYGRDVEDLQRKFLRVSVVFAILNAAS